MHKRLLQLLRDNAQRDQSPLRVENSVDANEATIYLYDVIDPYWGVSATDFNKALAELNGKPVALRINSPGGDVFDGRAMATAIAQHGNVTAYIDGIAASAATYVALAAKNVQIADGAFFMIHNAWTLAYGNKNDLAETAALLDKIDAAIINDYIKKTGKTSEEIAAWMNAETWFSAQEAVDHGFADSLFNGADAQDRAWDLSAYEHAPKALTEKKPEEPIANPYRAQAEHRMRLFQIA